MKNAIPRSANRRIALASCIVPGLTLHATKLPFTPDMTEEFVSEIAQFKAARVGALNASRTRAAKAAAKTAEGKSVRRFVVKAKSTLMSHFGNIWTPEWITSGFQNGSLQIGRKKADYMAQQLFIIEHLLAYPAHEYPAAGVTAAIGQVIHQRAVDAEIEANTAKREAKAMIATRDELDAKIQKRITLVRTAVAEVFGDEGLEWYDFGFSRPVDPMIPEIPGTVEVQPDGSGRLTVKWPDSRRADRFRVIIRSAAGAAEDAPIVVRKTYETEVHLIGLPSGMQVTVTVQAVNSAGASAETVAVQIVVP